MILTEAKKELIDAFKTYWEAFPISSPVPVAIPNQEFEKPSNSPFIRLEVRHSTGGAASISTKHFIRKGFFFVQVFTLFESGSYLNDQLCQIALNAFDGKDINGIWFRDSTVREVGPDGKYYQQNVLHSFEYDEHKS